MALQDDNWWLNASEHNRNPSRSWLWESSGGAGTGLFAPGSPFGPPNPFSQLGATNPRVSSGFEGRPSGGGFSGLNRDLQSASGQPGGFAGLNRDLNAFAGGGGSPRGRRNNTPGFPTLPGGIDSFMGNPAVIAAVNAQIAALNRPLKGEVRQERRELKDRTGMHKALGKDYKRTAKQEERRIAGQAAQREAARAKAVQEASADFENRQARAAGGVAVDETTQQRMRDEGLTQEQRMRDLIRADAEFSSKGSDTIQDLVSGYASAADASTRQAIDQDTTASGEAIRGIRGQIAANRQMRPQLMMQLAQQYQDAAQRAFQNQVALRQLQADERGAAQAMRLEREKMGFERDKFGMDQAQALVKAYPNGLPDYSLVEQSPGHYGYKNAPKRSRTDIEAFAKSLGEAATGKTIGDMPQVLKQWAAAYGIPYEDLHNDPQLYSLVQQVVSQLS